MDFWRQLDIVSESELQIPITVIGAGGIGSPVCLALAKMGCGQLAVYDDDTVEMHNLPNQLYRIADLGKPKVAALAEIVQAFTGTAIATHAERVDGQRLAGLIVSGVDSMAARRQIWEQTVRYKPGVRLYIDARMGAEVCRIYTVRPVDPDDVRLYEATLYSDDEAEDEPCTARSIIYNVLPVAGLVANQVKKYVKGELLSREIVMDLKTLILFTNE